MMRQTTIGRKDTRIELQSRTVTNDPVTNEEIYTYSTLACVWAEQVGPTSREAFEAQQQVARREVRFRVRYSSRLANCLDETCLVKRDNETYQVSGIEMIGRRSEILITAEKRDNE